jgi:lipoate-protein ligase A
MGSGNNADTECNLAACEADNIPVLRRYGGGGTVLLYPGCVVVSIGCWVAQQFQNNLYFKIANQSVIDSLALAWPEFHELSQRGLSDLAYRERKVAGTSLFRSRNYLLYQASLIVESNIDAISKYLRHPSKEPEYRKGKAHREFLTSLNDIVSGLTAETVSLHLAAHIASIFIRNMGAELSPPMEEQRAHILARAAKGRHS